MKGIFISVTVFTMISLLACGHKKSEQENTPHSPTLAAHQPPNAMKQVISIVEIPVTDFARAVKFYETILDVHIEEVDMADTHLGVLPGAEGTAQVVLIKGDDYTPTSNGSIIYLNAGHDLQPMLDNIVGHGGQVIVPKTEISPEMGFFALFTDTEGNRMGLHSSQ